MLIELIHRYDLEVKTENQQLILSHTQIDDKLNLNNKLVFELLAIIKELGQGQIINHPTLSNLIAEKLTTEEHERLTTWLQPLLIPKTENKEEITPLRNKVDRIKNNSENIKNNFNSIRKNKETSKTLTYATGKIIPASLKRIKAKK